MFRVTSVTVQPVAADPTARLLAFASFTIDDAFRIRDARVIRADDGRVFVSMPSRTRTDRCGYCRGRVELPAAYCSHCGADHPEGVPAGSATGRARYTDVAFPVHEAARAEVERAVIGEYRRVMADRDGRSSVPVGTAGGLG